MADLTLLLDALHCGEPTAARALLAQVWAEPRQLARAKMARGQPGHTLQSTALVHEAWLWLGETAVENTSAKHTRWRAYGWRQRLLWVKLVRSLSICPTSCLTV